MVSFLLTQGANPNIQEASGLTALHWAVSHGNIATVKALLAGGANLNLQNSHGQSALDLAQANGKVEAIALLSGHT